MTRPRTIATPAALRRDTRFQACSPGAKWVYGHVCDRERILAERGMDALGTVALVVEGLGDTPREVLAPLLHELEERGLVEVLTDRVEVAPAQTAVDHRGPRGGLSGAERTARWRAGQGKATPSVTQKPVTQSVTVTDSPSHNPSHSPKSDGSLVTSNSSQSVGCDGKIGRAHV